MATNSCKLFVGQVPASCSEETLRSIFDLYGEIQEVAILKNRETGKCRGCAFVTFTSKEEGENAIAALSGKMVLDGARREMIVSIATIKKLPSDEECKLYVGMLSPQTTEDEIRDMFGRYGDITEVHIMQHKDGTNKGSAFVKFTDQKAGRSAIDALHGRIKDKDMPKLLQVRPAFTAQDKFDRMREQSDLGSNMNSLPGFSQRMLPQSSPYGQLPFNPLPVPYLQHQRPFAGVGIPRLPTHPYMPNQPNVGRGFGLGLSPYAMQQHQHAIQQQHVMQQQQRVIQQQQQLETQRLIQERRKQNNIRGPNGANIFVFGIPDTYSDEDLGSLFSTFGTVLSSNIQNNAQTGKSRGFGFVSFNEQKSAETAINAMNGFVIGSKRLEVRLKKRDGPAHRPY